MSEIRGTVTVGDVIFNDYAIRVEKIEGGHRLSIVRGSEVQTIDVMGGVNSVNGVGPDESGNIALAAGAGAFWVQLAYRIEGEETVFTSDKTLDEMLEAHAAGQLVCVNCDMEGMGLPLYPVLTLVSERTMCFASTLVIGSANYLVMTVTPDGWMQGLPD